jgi:Cys-tRNA(Pro)/Cys-tRNA(Cys) deacylase
MTKTNAIRLLDAAGLSYRTAEYDYDESDLSVCTRKGRRNAAEQVFKTLVTRGDRTVFWCSASRGRGAGPSESGRGFWQ